MPESVRLELPDKVVNAIAQAARPRGPGKLVLAQGVVNFVAVFIAAGWALYAHCSTERPKARAETREARLAADEKELQIQKINGTPLELVHSLKFVPLEVGNGSRLMVRNSIQVKNIGEQPVRVLKTTVEVFRLSNDKIPVTGDFSFNAPGEDGVLPWPRPALSKSYEIDGDRTGGGATGILYPGDVSSAVTTYGLQGVSLGEWVGVRVTFRVNDLTRTSFQLLQVGMKDMLIGNLGNNNEPDADPNHQGA